MHYAYFIESEKNSKIYVGTTQKIPKDRLADHNSGLNKFTKANRPFKLIYYEQYFCEADAFAREKFYKTGFGRIIKQTIVKSLKTRGGSSIG